MTAENHSPYPDRLLRAPAVREYLGGMSHGALYDKLDSASPRYDPSFPRPYRLGPRAVAWKLSEIQSWLDTRKSAIGDAPRLD